MDMSLNGHGRGISASPPPPPAQQSSWSAALVPAIRDVDSPPPQDRGLDASFPPVTHALSAPPAMTSLRSPESFFPGRLPPRRLRLAQLSVCPPSHSVLGPPRGLNQSPRPDCSRCGWLQKLQETSPGKLSLSGGQLLL
ncbi:hypothetical protein CapIbe_019094 [Capra ibex]